VPCSVESQCYCFSQASHAEFYKPGRILQAQISALAVGRGLEPIKIRFPNSRMPIGKWFLKSLLDRLRTAKNRLLKVRLHYRSKSMLDEFARRVFDKFVLSKAAISAFLLDEFSNSSLQLGTLFDNA
jgi:hypothetical protein